MLAITKGGAFHASADFTVQAAPFVIPPECVKGLINVELPPLIPLVETCWPSQKVWLVAHFHSSQPMLHLLALSLACCVKGCFLLQRAERGGGRGQGRREWNGKDTAVLIRCWQAEEPAVQCWSGSQGGRAFLLAMQRFFRGAFKQQLF